MVLPAVLAFIVSSPLLSGAVLGVLLSLFGGYLFGVFQTTLQQLAFLAIGLYVLVRYGIPALTARGMRSENAVIVVAIALLFIFLGIDKTILGIFSLKSVALSIVP